MEETSRKKIRASNIPEIDFIISTLFLIFSEGRLSKSIDISTAL